MERVQLFDQPDFLAPFDDLGHFRGSRFGITGATGVLGKILMARLKLNGIETTVFAGDVTDGSSVNDWLDTTPLDFIVHLAAVVPVAKVEADPWHAYRVNAIGSFNVAEAMARHHSKAWLFLASTSHVYQPSPSHPPSALRETDVLNPSSLYGASKLAGERLVAPLLERLDLAACIGRIFSFTHQTQATPFLVPSLLDRIAAVPDGGELEVKSANSVRDILDAESVVDAMLHLARLRHTGLLNIGSGHGLTIEAIAGHLLALKRRALILRTSQTMAPDALVADVGKLRSLLQRP